MSTGYTASVRPGDVFGEGTVYLLMEGERAAASFVDRASLERAADRLNSSARSAARIAELETETATLRAQLADRDAEVERLKARPEMSDLENHWDAMAASKDGWAGPATRVLSEEEAHVFVEGVMVIVKRHGWLEQDRNIFDWIASQLAELARLREMPGEKLVALARSYASRCANVPEIWLEFLTKVTGPIRAQEREACASICDAKSKEWSRRSVLSSGMQDASAVASWCAAAIRKGAAP